MRPMNEIRSHAKAFYNALDFDKPISFGTAELVKNGQSERLYVERIHGDSASDPVQELAGGRSINDARWPQV